MKELFFSITLKNYTFNIRSNHKTTACAYETGNKYIASLTFAANTFGRIKYKNIMFKGTVTKRNIWKLFLDMHVVVQKRNNMYYFETIKSEQGGEKSKLSHDIAMDYPKNILYLYNQIINELSEQYFCIVDKENFRYQLCEYLNDSYFEIKNLDEILEYENYTDVESDEEPIIERYTARSIILNECKDFFISFHQAELDNIHKETIITLENVIKEVPELHEIPLEFLNQEFNSYLEKNYNDLIAPDIYYEQADVLYNIGMNLYESYKYYIFLNTVDSIIDEILSAMNVADINKDEIYSLCKTEYSKNNIPSDNELKQRVTTFINDYTTFNEIYNKFVSLFNDNHIKIEWDENKIKLFQKYDKKELTVDPHHFAEYEVYQYISPHYRKHLFKKNSNKYKPVVEQFSTFVSYASSILDVLFKCNILIDTGEHVIYNEGGDINAAYEEMEKLSNKESLI